jgi:SAM-dependent methyltransferase
MLRYSTRTNINKYLPRNRVQYFLVRNFLRKIKMILAELPPGRICDAGCGEGFVLKELLTHNLCIKENIVGTDIDLEALEWARAHGVDTGLICGSAYKMPFPTKAFQVTLLLEILEHLEHYSRALAEASRISWYLIVSVPHEPFFQMANFLRGKNLIRLGNNRNHIQHWNKKSFRAILNPYGTILRMETSFPWLIALVRTN